MSKKFFCLVIFSSMSFVGACGKSKRSDVPGASRNVYKSQLELTKFEREPEPLVPSDFLADPVTSKDWFARLGTEPTQPDPRPAKVDALTAEIKKRLLGEERFYGNIVPKFSVALWEQFYDNDGFAVGDQCGSLLRSMAEFNTLPSYSGPADEPVSSDKSFGEVTLIESCRYLEPEELRRHQLGTICTTEHRDPDSREFGDKASLVEIKRLGLVTDQIVANEYWNRTTMYMDNYGKVRDRGALANRALWNLGKKEIVTAWDQIEFGNAVWPQTGEAVSTTTERNRMSITAGEHLTVVHERYRLFDELVDSRDKLFEIKVELTETSPTEFSLSVSRRKTGETSVKIFKYVLGRATTRDEPCKVLSVESP